MVYVPAEEQLQMLFQQLNKSGSTITIHPGDLKDCIHRQRIIQQSHQSYSKILVMG